MKRIFAALSALLLSGAVAIVCAAQRPPAVGAYGVIPVTDPEVVAAANFAVKEESRREGRAISLVSISSAERQVVAGFNYRLRLSVRDRGQTREATAVVYQDLKKRYTLSSWEQPGAEGAAARTREVKVYLVRVGDAGKSGRKIGCDDSLVAVTRTVRADGQPLKAAVEELLSLPHEYEGGLGNYWWGENLKVSGASVSRGTATIRIKGEINVAGVCDEPRIEEQIKETARQFPGVRRVRVLVNGRTLSEVIR